MTKRALGLLDAVGLRNKANQMPNKLSGATQIGRASCRERV